MALKLEKLKVLVIEDLSPMRELIKNVLEGMGVGQTFMAENGEEGFDVFCRENPDIILCDWDMPGFTGLDFTKEVRTNRISPNRMVPIIMISGYNAAKRIFEARDSGVTEYMIKPFTAAELAKRIGHVVNRPRDFLETEDFTGPDRRRSNKGGYDGPLRREEDNT